MNYRAKVKEKYEFAVCLETIPLPSNNHQRYKILKSFLSTKVLGRGHTEAQAWKDAYRRMFLDKEK